MSDFILFDRLRYLDRLTKAGMPEQLARAHAEAIDEALRESVATKRDIEDLKREFKIVRNEIQMAVRDMTIRMGAIAIALFAALASIKFFTP